MISIRTFAAEVPPALVREFLACHKISLTDQSFEGTATALARDIDAAISECPPGTRGRLMSQIEDIDQLASPQGEIAIADTVLEVPANLPSSRARAVWLYLHDRDGFGRAEDVLYANSKRGGRDWSGFMGRIGVALRLDADAKASMAQALKVYFDCENLEIEAFERQGPAARDDAEGAESPSAWQIMIFREGLPQSEREFANGNLVMRSRKPVIEAALTYEPETGIIECVASSFKVRDDVVRAFASTMLDAELEVVPKVTPMYSLEALRTRTRFDSDPADQIEEVSIRYMQLVPEGATATRITFEHKPMDTSDIWTEIERRLGSGALSSDFGIRQAKLHISYRPQKGRKTRSLLVSVTPPNRSSLRDATAFERMIAMKYLPRWGIVEAQR